MASMRGDPDPAYHQEKRGSRGFPFQASEENSGDVRPQIPTITRTQSQPGTFHQYELVDLDPLLPVTLDPGLRPISGASSTGTDVSRAASFGHSDTDTLLAAPRKSSSPKRSPENPTKRKMLTKSGKGGSNSKGGNGSNNIHLSPLMGADPTVGAKLASHSPERDGRYGYSLTDHNCQIRPGGSAASPRPGNWDPQTSRHVCKAPVPVPRSKRDPDSSRPTPSTSSTSAPSTAGTGSQKPGARPEVIIRQPGKENANAQNTHGALRAGTRSSKAGSKSDISTSKKGDKDKNTKDKKEEANGKAKQAQVNSIPQTNFMIGLLVTCCFNPPLGIIAMGISLRAAAAYRDGDKKKGACLARWSIIVSLFSIMLTMVVVSTLLVWTAVDKHGYGKRKTGKISSSPFGF